VYRWAIKEYADVVECLWVPPRRAFFLASRTDQTRRDFNERAYRKERGSNGWADVWIDSKVEYAVGKLCRPPVVAETWW